MCNICKLCNKKFSIDNLYNNKCICDLQIDGELWNDKPYKMEHIKMMKFLNKLT